MFLTVSIMNLKISVILHPQSSVSNAFVVWAPKRVEFYTIPDQDIYPQNWIDQLAIHEFRHVVQLDKLNQGLTKILYFLLGQQAIGAVTGLYLPLWFLEGDAVVTETTLSHTGRGRLPEFTMPLRAQVLQRKIYSYEKAYFGSFRDFVPNYYYLGYQLVGYTRNRYSSEVWSKSMDNAARRPYNPMPFNQGIKRSTGLSKWKLYDSCMYFCIINGGFSEIQPYFQIWWIRYILMPPKLLQATVFLNTYLMKRL